MTVSQSRLPSRVANRHFAHAFNKGHKGALTSNDYLELRVYLDTMMVRQESHEPEFTFSSIFGESTFSGFEWHLGGQMGFFMGASLITLSELLETLAFTVYVFLHKKLMRIGQMDTRSPGSRNQGQSQAHIPTDNESSSKLRTAS
ncbi:acid-sensing ion channel 3 [Plakobranchus ocellatus]|uniref:Acid-sensing ion channel 3 n=1 Tax=Plakobranchus ocellatus TaxID=259542 RepID=A0AAV4ADK4_9GAST|nr:acid-sensing ion channel 3 [Plakobranchus ocellatus]